MIVWGAGTIKKYQGNVGKISLADIQRKKIKEYTMKNFGRFSRFFAFVAVFSVGTLISSCGIDPCYIGVADNPEESVIDSELQVNYFFDRTESLGGFTQDGKETTYGRAIDSTLTVGQTLGYETTSFYEFGEAVTCKLSFNTLTMQKEIKKKSFYGDGYTYQNDKNRTVVYENESQPFSSVVDYIKTETDKNSLNIVVTDLYEQFGINQYFHLLFQNAFRNGLSGAIFAVQSEFKGNIHSISSSNDSLYGVNGYSTFFLLITGDKDTIEKYGTGLSEELKGKKIKFNYTLFLPGGVFYKGEKKQPEYRTIGNEKQFQAASERHIMVNLNPAGQFIQRWKKKGGAFVPVKANAEGYLAVTNIDSQYVYKVPFGSDDDSSPTVLNMMVEYFNGRKTPPGNASRFEKISASGKIEEALADKTDGFNYISIKIHNKKLDKGYYRVNFDIIPDWVNALDANVAELKASNKRGELVKVLNLKLIYDRILKEFNKIDGFSEVFYIVKN
ncbi:MAG: hypothetical protein LBT01_03355 [Spirochaetaceae bacterium]|jgi:hypothetical protein|nr:hypothetical protein [Spirochaetaceae bacterium]